MTHILQVPLEDYKNGKNYMLLKPTRTLNVGDKIILECDGEQRDPEIIIHTISGSPLMKGWVLVEFEMKPALEPVKPEHQ